MWCSCKKAKPKRSQNKFTKRFSGSSPLSNYTTIIQPTMDSATASAESLRKQIFDTEDELKRLKEQLASVEAQEGLEGLHLSNGGLVTKTKWPLTAEEYRRYGRQMIVPSVGIEGTWFSLVLIFQL